MKTLWLCLLVGTGTAGLGFVCIHPDYAMRIFGAKAAGLTSVQPGSLNLPPQAMGGDQDAREVDKLIAFLRGRQYRDFHDALRIDGRKNPLRWLKWAGALSGAQHKPATDAILAGWYQAKPGAMLKWAESNERDFFSTEDFKEAAIESGNIPFALKGLALIADQAVKTGQIKAVFAGLAAQDCSKALEAAEGLDLAGRQAALSGVLPVLAGEFPDIALEVADASSDDPPTRNSLLQAIVNNWIAQKGIASAQAYFSQQQVSANLDGGYAALASAVAVANPSDCGVWLNRISDPALREKATLAVIARITDSNPDIASRLVTDLMDGSPGRSNETVTLARLETTVRPWVEKDPPAAFSYIYSLNEISSPGRRALLQKLALVGPQ